VRASAALFQFPQRQARQAGTNAGLFALFGQMTTQPECEIVTALKAEVARLQSYVQDLYEDRLGRKVNKLRAQVSSTDDIHPDEEKLWD